MIEPLITALKIDKFDFNSVKTAFDIGSRDGLQALELASAFPLAQVYAVECNPDTLPLVRQNIAVNPRVSAVGVAVSNFSGEVTFHKIDRDATVTPHADGNPGASSLFVARTDYPQETYVQVPVTVACQTLNDICEERDIDYIDVIWMDLRGAELKAFAGLAKRITKTRYIFVELTHTEIYCGQPLFDEVNAYLEACGFERISAINHKSYFEDVIYRNTRFFQPAKAHVVLSQPWGGLGDNLALSTLPELYARKGIASYLSADNATRNNEIRDIAWADHPFIQGTLNAPANAGSITYEQQLPAISLVQPFMQRIEAAHALEPRNAYPEVFRKPHYQVELSGKILIDLGSVSVTGGSEKLTRYIQHVLSAYKYRMEDLLQVRFSNYQSQHSVYFSNIALLNIASLHAYHDALYSAYGLITVHSGAQSLAVATRTSRGCQLQRIHCFATPYQFNSRIYIFDDVEYFIE